MCSSDLREDLKTFLVRKPTAVPVTIIGGGFAGIHCIEGIRSLDTEGQITLVTAEPDSNYGRPLISYYLEGSTDEGRMSYRGADFYERNAVTVLHRACAEKLDPEAKTVTLTDGQTLPYDELCVASGSSPFVPPFAGLDTVPLEKRFTFMTLEDARALSQSVTRDSRVLIIGGGLIGLKCAEGIKDRAAKITVCDLAARLIFAPFELSTGILMSFLGGPFFIWLLLKRKEKQP